MKKFIVTLLMLLGLAGFAFGEDHEASSLSYDDIATAVALCSDGDTLVLPAGDTTDDWSSILDVPNGVSIRGQGIGTTIIRNNDSSYYMMYINYGDDSSSNPVEISDFSIYSTGAGSSGGSMIKIYHCEKVYPVIHDMWFEDSSAVAINFNSDATTGLIYDCTFKDIYPADLGSTGYGICIYGDNIYDPTVSLGTANAIFVEDCTFINCKHGVAQVQGGHAVVRYCTFSEPVSNRFLSDVHGYQDQDPVTQDDGDPDNVPGSTWEYYYNVFNGSDAGVDDEGLGLRGGSGVAFENDFYDHEDPGFPGTPSAHKAIRISGDDFLIDYHPGSDGVIGGGRGTEPMYFWNNTLNDTALTDVSVVSALSGYVAEDTEYFMNSKGGYTPYTYPHPDNDSVAGEQGDFPKIYIDASAGDGGTGAQADPYNEYSDINWTTGDDNSVYDYLDDAPATDVEILSKNGEELRESLIFGTSGTSLYNVKLGSYGSGAIPIINGSDLVVTWEEDSSEESTSWSDLNTNHVTTSVANIFHRVPILASTMGDNGTEIRVQIGSNSSFDILVDGCSVGVRSGTTPDYASAPTRITFDTGANGTTVLTGVDKWSDWVSYTWTDSAVHLIHVNVEDEGGTGTCRMVRRDTYLNGSYYFYGAGDFTLTEDVSTDGLSSNHYQVQQIEIRTTGVTDVWNATLSIDPGQVWFDDTLGTGVGSVVACDGTGEWFWESNVLYVYSTSDPDTNYTDPGIEASVRDYCVDVNGEDYIEINNLRFEKAKVTNVVLDATNKSEMNYCISLDGLEGVEIDTAVSIIQNSIIYDCVDGVDVDATGYIKNSVIWNCTDDLEESGESINKVTNIIEDDGGSDPLFVSPSTRDFTLAVGSPCINRGTHVYKYLDIIDNPVPIGHSPDIGAYESKHGANIWKPELTMEYQR